MKFELILAFVFLGFLNAVNLYKPIALIAKQKKRCQDIPFPNSDKSNPILRINESLTPLFGIENKGNGNKKASTLCRRQLRLLLSKLGTQMCNTNFNFPNKSENKYLIINSITQKYVFGLVFFNKNRVKMIDGKINLREG